ncbi:MAG TPA: NAD+ synthase [Ignavibacteriaceae bacterium]|nr:NAD+ synthase [Ignavibacteriaceae bacterium]
MKIALCQINTIIGDIAGNKNNIISGYRRAEKDGADLVIFPELALLGYPPLDLIEKKEFRKAVAKAANEIASVTKDTGIIFGSITEDDDNIGTDVHNSAIMCYEGEIKFVQHKSLIPNYDVFDEMRYFDPAKEIFIHKFKGEKLGISICEDIWNDADYWHVRRYTEDPVANLIGQGASVLLNISASPYAYGKRKDRKKMLSVLTKGNKIPLAYVCCVGAQTDLIFDGASMCFDGNGELVCLGNSFDEDYFIFETNGTYASIKETEKTFEEEVLNSLIFGVKEYCRKQGFKDVVVGLSGGIDSALVTYIAVQALGKENVHVVMMPSQYSSRGSKTDSLKLIENLGITSEIISIKSAYTSFLKLLSPVFGKKKSDVTEENLQARIRGINLMAISNKFNYLLLTTGNKSEMAVGYCTLYGDMCGGLAVIADVYKTDVYRIAKFINKENEIIPDEIISKPPSAELRENQKDQDSLPPYELLDRILKMYLEENKEYKEIVSEIGDEETVSRILDLIDKNEYKRFQSAPALRVSTKAFGYGRRFPIVQGWRKQQNT